MVDYENRRAVDRRSFTRDILRVRSRHSACAVLTVNAWSRTRFGHIGATFAPSSVGPLSLIAGCGSRARSVVESSTSVSPPAIMKTMMKLRLTRLLAGLILLCFCQSGYAQQTIVAASRSVDWRQAGLPGDTPPARNTICSTLNGGATAAQINSAIAARSEEHTSELQSPYVISY